MTRTMKLRRIGNSLGITVPKDVLHHLGLEEGDEVFVVRTEGGAELTRYDPEFERAIEISRKVLHSYPNAMKKLADGI